MRVAIAAAAVAFAALVAVFTLINSQELPPGELERRCAASNPAWNGYQEDIKEIGARPVAQWQGAPVAARATEGGVYVTMALQPPWADWDAALPLLLKDPLGTVHRNVESEKKDGHRVYVFPPVPGTAQSPPPWVELQYPHVRQRIHLDASGAWHSTEGEMP